MRKLLRELIDRVGSGQPVAMCRLVETRGSTPQKAGALMLVFADGSQAGTLGGGCVEAEVKRQALGILADGDPQIVTFQLDNDYGWDDGLICGGRMQILVDPIRTVADRGYYDRLLQEIDTGSGCLEAIVFDAEKSGLPACGCYLFAADGQFILARSVSEELLTQVRAEPVSVTALAAGDVAAGDVAAEAPPAVYRHMPLLADRPRPKAIEGISYLPVLPRCRLLIVGAGHVGQAVGNLAVDLDFDVWVVDDREQYANRERFPRAERVIVAPIVEALPGIEITASTYCIIVTRGHNHDEEALYHLVNRGARYLGMIGSSRKIRLIFDDLLAEGISSEALAQVYAPLGLDIGSQTVPEIAVSILAELISHRNLGGQVPGRRDTAIGQAECGS